MKTYLHALLAAGIVAFVSAVALARPEPPPLAATLAEDLKTTTVPLTENYAKSHPRLLFSAEDVAGLKQKAEAHPDLWKEVLASAQRLGNEVPDAAAITAGQNYWRIESVESAALAYLVTGDKVHLERAKHWLLAHTAVPVWGQGFRDNVDLQASWYLYHLAVAYDALYNDLTPADRKAISHGLAVHAQAIYDSLDPEKNKSFTYDQNHGYIPAVALAAGALALLDDVPEAEDWLKRDYAYMRRARNALGDDGWYYEGTGYWAYAFHWHLHYADLMARAREAPRFELLMEPNLRDNWRFALYTSLPGPPRMFDIGDSGEWKDGHRAADLSLPHAAMLYDLAAALHCGEARTVADLIGAGHSSDYPSAAFLWYDEAVPAVPIERIKPYYNFADHGYVAWRSGWDKDATVALFRCGPPLGHGAAADLRTMKDWRINTGHVHADIGGFWLFAKGAYLASGTGYTAEKWTRDQNTILIDGVGQADDGDYHNTIHYPYDKLDRAQIDHLHLDDSYAFASGEYGPVYPEAKVGQVSLRRSVLVTQRWLLVLDDLSAEKPHKLTWICHSDNEFKKDGPALLSRHEKAALAVLPLEAAAEAMDDKMEPTTVMAGNSPGAGKPAQRGFQIVRTQKDAAKAARLVHLLVPLGADDKLPAVKMVEAPAPSLAFTITWPDGKVESVTVDGAWTMAGPVAKTNKDPVKFVFLEPSPKEPARDPK